ncbi:MAG: aminotransferase class III-fold pyridoxal phosphate-dependent enzyme, partial [Proteobacteria bacterium]|nr:aminotransferase class III-fold pyridoxal phosphate-dependent enzyme [Pseudomonadota bacterium]
PYFNTLGGNPVSPAARTAVPELLAPQHLTPNARTTGAYVVNQLNRLMDRHPLIGDVRGKGMFFAVELVTDRNARTPATAQAKRLINLMRERGVLISRIGINDNILKIRPPMPFKPEHADLLIDTLDQALAGL